MGRHFRTVAVALLAGTLAGGVLACPGSAATKPSRGDPAAELVEKALKQEAQGADAKRDELLSKALAEDPQFAPARWHAGYVERDHRWVKFDEAAADSAGDLRLTAYRNKRAEAPETVEGQLELARWCAKRSLDDQARAHLTWVLDRQPDHPDARRMLGHQLVGGTWMSPEEIGAATERVKALGAAVQEWRPYLLKTLGELVHRSPQRREHGLSRFRGIDDPAAIEPIELIFCVHSRPAAMLAIEWLDKRPEQEAAWALARQAVVSPWFEVREAAALALKTRDVHDYVPALLSAMGSSVQSRASLYRAPSGRLMYRHVLMRRGPERDEMAVFETEYRNTVLTAETPLELGASRAMLDEARRRDAAMKAQLRELAVLQHNLRQQQINDRIAWVLSTATGEDVPATAEHWWQWWNDYNEVYTGGAKPIRGTYQRESVAFSDPYAYEPTNYPDPPPSPPPTSPPPRPISRSPGLRMMYECLVADTPVWTETGPVAIEAIRIGDRVLSQDPNTGCLAYKPVLRTTSRAPEHLVTITAGGETIRSSGGHPFWVAGQGWTKARELKPGSYLHGAHGTTPVEAVAQEGHEPTYNLIVGDFHTYFVGKDLVLSHDNTIRAAMRGGVPGLSP